MHIFYNHYVIQYITILSHLGLPRGAQDAEHRKGDTFASTLNRPEFTIMVCQAPSRKILKVRGTLAMFCILMQQAQAQAYEPRHIVRKSL